METRLRIGKQLQKAPADTPGYIMGSVTGGEAAWVGGDPDGSTKVLVWDDTANAIEWATISGGLSFDGSDLTSTATGSTFSDSAFEVYDNVDNTKKLKFEVSGVTTATTRTLTVPNASGTIALTSDIGNGTLTLSMGSAAATNNTVTVATGTGFSANASGNSTYQLSIGPALTALAAQMTGAGTGFLRKNGADTFSLDTATYLTSSTGVTTFSAGTTGLTPNSPTSGAVVLAGTLAVGNGGTGTTTGSITGTGALTFTAGGTNTNINLVPNGTGTVDVASKRITNVAAPTAGTDAANKTYVDNAIQGLDAKASVRVATTGSITLSGTQTIDGISVIAGNRVLVKNQGTASANGIYVVAAGAWTRATDMDHWDEVPSAYVWVEEGTVNGDTGWVCTSDAGGTIGSTAMNWVQFGGASTYTASLGVQKVGNDFRLDINSLTNDWNISTNNLQLSSDTIAFYDNSAAAHRKVTVDQLLQGANLSQSSNAVFQSVTGLLYLAIADTAADHYLLLDTPENLTANRTLNFHVNDGNRTLRLDTDLTFVGTGSAAGDFAMFTGSNTVAKRTKVVRYVTGITGTLNTNSGTDVKDEDGATALFAIPSDHKTHMAIYRNGVRQAFSGTQSRDYSISGNVITFTVTPESWETFVIEVIL
jgi:hypothetical protein